MDRERITISIKKHVLSLIDKQIDGVNIRNRSHAIESFTLKLLNENASFKAVVLLGGDNALKSVRGAVDFINKLSDHNISDIIIATGFLGDKVKERIDKEKVNEISLRYSDKGEGSGGALLSLKKDLGDVFIVFNNKENLNLDIDELISYHRQHNALVTVATSDLSSLDGIYVFNSEVFKYFPKGYSMIQEDIFSRLIKEGKLVVYPVISE